MASFPDAPTNIQVFVGVNNYVSVQFEPPANTGGSPIVEYRVQVNPGGAVVTGNTSPIYVGNLQYDVSYTFSVTAVNQQGYSSVPVTSEPITISPPLYEYAARRAIIYVDPKVWNPVPPTIRAGRLRRRAPTVPGAPRFVTGSPGNTEIIVSFSPPESSGGFPIISYTVTSSPDGFTATGSSSPLTVTGLTNGLLYTFTVTATNSLGIGLPSAPSAPVAPAILPGPPTNLVATGGDSRAYIAFTAPTGPGSSTIIRYTAVSNPDGFTGTGVSSPIVVMGLTNGSSYTFTVRATNTGGTGPFSDPSNSVIPARGPDPPTNVSAVAGNEEAVISFAAPDYDGGLPITGYLAASYPDEIRVTGTSSPITLTGLTNGTSYTFRVRAINDADTGLPSEYSNAVTPATTPDAPTSVVATPGNGEVSVSFDAPYNGGVEIIYYTATSSPEGLSGTSVTSPVVVEGLTNGVAYTFTVTATNSVGTGPESEASNLAIPVGSVPDAPTDVSAVAGNGQAVVSFTAPEDTGGYPITSYTVRSSPGGFSATGASSPITVYGLVNGTAYTFTVTATNITGTGPASSPSSAVTPLGPPGAPTITDVTSGDAQATVSFSPPASDGGVAITSYTVTSSPDGITATGSASPITVTGLTNGTTYTFTVQAINDLGTGPASAESSEVTPYSVPDAPTEVLAEAGNQEAVVSFTVPENDGGTTILSYIVTSSPNAIVATGTSSPITVPGLTNGVTYTFTVQADNAVGTGAASEPSNAVTPIGSVPGAPTSVTATADNATATVSFVAPDDDGGYPITSYTVVSNPGGRTATGASSPITVTGLTNGTTYTFTVRAINTTGTGSASSPSAAVMPVGPPDAPTGVTGAAGNQKVTISFTAPNNNGAPIINYTVTSSPENITAIGTSSPIIVTDLTNGLTYTFTVTATNEVGVGPASSPSAAITPNSTSEMTATVGTATTVNNQTGGNAFPAIFGTDRYGCKTLFLVTAAELQQRDVPAGTIMSIAFNVTAAPSTPLPCKNFTIKMGNTTRTSLLAATTAASVEPNLTTVYTLASYQPIVGTNTFEFEQGFVWNGISNVMIQACFNNTTFTRNYQNTYTATVSNTVCYYRADTSTVCSSDFDTASNRRPNFTIRVVYALDPEPPGAPTITSAVGGNRQATISFTAPASDGGALITSYTATSNPGEFTATSSGSPITVTGLTNGTSYTFTVVATNVAGSGPASLPSLPVTPEGRPGAPTGVTAVAGVSQATVSFTPPTFTGASAITHYTATSSPGGITATSSGSPIVVTGLTNGVSYTFAVTATNSDGTGPASDPSNSVTPSGLPGAPTGVSAVGGNAQAIVSFTAPTNIGGSAITSYTVTSNPGNITATGSGSPITVTGLTNGTLYTFTVTATNSFGTGPASTPSNAVTPQGLPGAPTDVTAVAGNAQATVSFTAPTSVGGSPITHYTVTSSPGNITASGAASPITVTGLTNGVAYTFTVTATNVDGTGPASAPPSSPVTPAGPPGAPTNVSAVTGNAQAIVSFTAPADNGGATITSYTVTSSPGGITASGSASPITVTGLTNGTAYTFTVTATNSAGTGPASSASAAVTPVAEEIVDTTIGTATTANGTQSYPAVFGTYYWGVKTLFIFDARELQARDIPPATITQIAFNVIAPLPSNPQSLTNFTIRMGHTSLSSFSGTTSGAVINASLTTVYTISSYLPVLGTNLFELSPGFAWDGSSNMMVQTCFNNASFTTNYLNTFTATNQNTVTWINQDTATVCSANMTSVSVNRPNTTLRFVFNTRPLPGAPTGVSATADDQQATISFTPPTVTGGLISSYTVTSNPGGITASGTASPIVVTGLTNGTAYTFTVTATNTAGTGPASAPTSAVTPQYIITVTVGTGTNTYGQQGYPTLFATNAYSCKTLLLIRGTELIALGVSTTRDVMINRVTINVTGAQNATTSVNNYTIKMGHTADITASTSGTEPAMNTVLTVSGAYKPVLGANTFDLTNPFPWNGASNIYVQTCFAGTTKSRNYTTPCTTVSGFNGCAYIVNETSTSANLCGTTTVLTATTIRPNITLRFTD
jgi:large repetitive protein